MKEIRIVENADNETVMPFGNQVEIVGYVDEVNGSSAAEVSGFVPTRHELVQLVQYWERIALDAEWWWFIEGTVGSSDMRRQAFARRRINRIWDLIGREEAEQAIDEARAEFAKDIEPKLWDIFLHGDEAQRRAVKEETWRLEEEESKRAAAGQIMSGHSDSKDPYSGGE
jgi:hypothetical protein